MATVTKWVRSGVLAKADELVAELGGDFAVIAHAAGLDPTVLDEPDTPIPIIAVPRLLVAAEQMLACPSFALQLGQRQELSLFGPLFNLFVSATSVGELIGDVVETFPLHTQGAILGKEQAGDGLIVTYELAAAVYISQRHIVELGFSVLIGEVRRHAPGWTPGEVWFRHARPADLDWYHALFGRNLAFDADRNAVMLGRDLLAQPTRSADPELHARLAAEYRDRVRRSPDLIAGRAEQLIRAALPFHPITLEEGARLMQMSRRTLQRRLTAVGTSFEEIIDAVRADLARSYLAESRLKVGEIAEILQFSETSALSRAVRRWHGKSPRDLRRAGFPADQFDQ